MSLAKTHMDAATVLAFLRRTVGGEIDHLEVIKGGETSQAFSFRAGRENLVIRLHQAAEGETDANDFRKDRFAAVHFSRPGIPIPAVVDIGTMAERLFYIITVKCPGRSLDSLDDREMKAIQPAFMSVLDSIHAVDISQYPGYGPFDSGGTAHFRTWKDFILSIFDESLFNWSRLFQSSLFEKDVFDRFSTRIRELVECVPEERRLVHGDYGFGNVFADGDRITGVLDWESALFGDPLYELGHLIVQGVEIGKAFDRCDERVLCYVLHDALLALHFYAGSAQKDKYEALRNRILDILSRPDLFPGDS